MQVDGGNGVIAARASSTAPMENASLIRGCATVGTSAGTLPTNAIALLLHPPSPPPEEDLRGCDQWLKKITTTVPVVVVILIITILNCFMVS